VCILLCITICKSDRITVTTTKTSRFIFIINLASLLHVSVSQGPSSDSYMNTNTKCHCINEHNRLMFYRRLPRFVIRCVGVVCDVMCICLKCINIIQVLIICDCVYY
jgi:DMSO reductase anchor subunit